MKKNVGKISTAERDEIKNLFTRKNGLAELVKILDKDNIDLYEKVIADLAETGIAFDAWWDSMFKKYQWESTDDGHWEIDFDNCSIYLVTPE